MKIYKIETEIKDFKNHNFDLQDILYDLYGYPMLEYNLKDKNSRQQLFADMKYFLDTNTPMFITNQNDNDDEAVACKQIIYPILSYFIINEEHLLTLTDKNLDKSVSYNKSFEGIKKEYETFDSNELPVDNDKRLSVYLFKLMIINEKDNELKTDYSQRILLDGNREELADMLYPPSSNSFTFICNLSFNKAINEIIRNFSRIIVINNKFKEYQINGKFIKVLRTENKITEFKSRWIYTFNNPNEWCDLIIGIHQPNKNLGMILNYLHVGLVVLNYNMGSVSFVDYLKIKDFRQSFIKLRLPKGSYIFVPM